MQGELEERDRVLQGLEQQSQQMAAQITGLDAALQEARQTIIGMNGSGQQLFADKQRLEADNQQLQAALAAAIKQAEDQARHIAQEDEEDDEELPLAQEDQEDEEDDKELQVHTPPRKSTVVQQNAQIQQAVNSGIAPPPTPVAKPTVTAHPVKAPPAKAPPAKAPPAVPAAKPSTGKPAATAPVTKPATVATPAVKATTAAPPQPAAASTPWQPKVPAKKTGATDEEYALALREFAKARSTAVGRKRCPYIDSCATPSEIIEIIVANGLEDL